MWNIKSINPICQRKKLTDDQERMMKNISTMKKTVKNDAPWQPSHSLSKWSNKYTHETDEKIVYQNNILLNKMMDIQKPNNRSQSQLPSMAHVSQQTGRRFEQSKIMQENQKMLKRLQSASSLYTRKFWQPDDEKTQKYKEIILKRTKINDDYYDLARKNMESRSTNRMIQSNQGSRKPQLSSQYQSDELLYKSTD